ncbi:uncharacterized protein DS421_10g288090 [Arachis hypogaea]|nr:uncharacterized protein DS421_10g288090 [Arachis hypogaea]
MLQTKHYFHEMETIATKSVTKGRSNNKLSKTIHKLTTLNFASNNALFFLTTHETKAHHHQAKNKNEEFKARTRRRAVMEALIARLFAGVTTIKASYAELQMAQQPYNNEAIQKADQAVVDELISISELKKRYLKKELNISSPQVTLMLAEVQEQQSLMKTFGITIQKLQSLVDTKDSEISSLKKQLHECTAFNKSLEKKLHSSASLSKFENLHLSALNTTHFIHSLQHTLSSMKSFTKLMIKEMESSNWDLELAAKCIQPDAVFIKQNHQCYAFESFVNMTMFEGFNIPSEPLEKHHNRNLYLENFKRHKSLNTKHYLSAHDPNSSKLLKLNNGGVPDSAFFVAFAEMAKRVWCLHCLALSLDEDVRIFQVKKNTRFSEAYMECEAEQVVSTSSEEVTDSDSGELRVGFTVVPGFMIGKSVIQSQVYLSPVS